MRLAMMRHLFAWILMLPLLYHIFWVSYIRKIAARLESASPAEGAAKIAAT